MAVLLNVPFVAQAAAGAGPYDPAACWHACASMLALHFRAAPRLALSELQKRNLGDAFLGPKASGRGPASDHEILAQDEQLGPVPRCASAHTYTLIELEDRLRTRGPIFFYWMKHGAVRHGHACVMTGTDATGIVYHDPAGAPGSKMTIAAFNSARQRWSCALMQRA